MYPEAESVEHYNELAEIWLSEVTQRRVHGTTGEVEVMFERESEHLSGLPWVPYNTSYVEGIRTSSPRYRGED